MKLNPTESPTDGILQRDPEFKSHLDSLGLRSIEAYTQWCAVNGFSTRLDKHWKQRCKELFFASQKSIQRRLATKKQAKRKPQQFISRIISGEIKESDLTRPQYLRISEQAAMIDDGCCKAAFESLLVHAQTNTGLLTTDIAAWPSFGNEANNDFISGLRALATHHKDWVRPLQAWKTSTRNVRRQFSSLSRHLMAKYAVPIFLDSVWFVSSSEVAAEQQTWYRRLGDGESLRNLDLPITLSKRAAHHFLNAPRTCNVESALRWSQVHALGGDERLANAILGSPIACDFTHNEFWASVIHWFARHSMLDPVQVGPLIDYIGRRKFEPQLFGEMESVDKVSDFSMKGRTPETLIRQMRQWHGQLRKSPKRPNKTWLPSGYGEFQFSEVGESANSYQTWTIKELLSRDELRSEGEMMRHCVASYDNSCSRGGTSIWSLGVERTNGRRKRVLTIEVANLSGKICQIRGKANRWPKEKELNLVKRWAAIEKLSFSSFF